MRAKRGAAGASLAALRKAAREAVNQTTMAAVARAARLEESTLRGFLRGARPKPAVRLRLVDWYLGLSLASGAVSGNSARCALAVLLAGVPPGDIGAAGRELLEVIARAHGGQAPGWVAALREEIDGV